MERIDRFLRWVVLKIVMFLLNSALFAIWFIIVVALLYAAKAHALSAYFDKDTWMYVTVPILFLLIYVPVEFADCRIKRALPQTPLNRWADVFRVAKLYMRQPWLWLQSWWLAAKRRW